jgi:3-oxoacyl-[acyl-carrier protein] reductase
VSRPDPLSLAGKAALVTGSGRGIGAAIAQLFAAHGASVMVTARTGAQIGAVADAIAEAGGIARAFSADLAEPAAAARIVEEAVARFGRLDILVHNAGIFPYHPLESLTDAAWQQVLDLNLGAGFRLLRAAVPQMRAQGGRILFTSSIQGNRAAVPGCAHYAASKGGINGLIRAAALELARYGITVNGVEPGLVLTGEVARALKPERRERMAKAVPLGRWGMPEEIAHAMLFLASDAAAYVTGQTLVVDGGATLPAFGG